MGVVGKTLPLLPVLSWNCANDENREIEIFKY